MDEEWEPQEGEEIAADDPRVRMYPDPVEVFVDDQPWLAEVLRPLVAVDLSALDPTWSGWLPFCDTVEPIDEMAIGLGEETEEFHGEHTGHEWMAFRLEGDRLRFLGDGRFFLRQALQDPTFSPGVDVTLAQVEEFYAEDAHAREECARTWAETGKLVWLGSEVPALELGGDLWDGNWTGQEPPSAYELHESYDGPPSVTLADGRPFRFVGQVNGWPWSESPYTILALFEPETRTVLVTHEYT